MHEKAIPQSLLLQNNSACVAAAGGYKIDWFFKFDFGGIQNIDTFSAFHPLQ